MAIDSGIYSNIGRGVKSVADYDNEFAQQRQNKLAEVMNGMKMQEYTEGRQRTNRLNSLLGSFKPDATPDDQVGQLTRGGFLTEARSLAESSSKVSKEKREAEKAQLESAAQKLAIGAQLLGGVKDQASYDAARETALAHGLDVSRMQPNYDPAFVAQKITEGKTLAQQIDETWKSKGYDLDVQKAGETQRHNKSTEGLTAQGQQIQVRGQNMTDSRARASQAQSASQHRETIAQGGKAPSGYRFTQDGNLQAIPGGPADIKTTTPISAKVNDAKDVLSLMDEVDKLLPNSTGSYAGAAADAAAGAFGFSTDGADAGAQLKALEGALIAKMPKMSGPQSDKDVLLYKQMAGQIGDQTKPVKQRQAAAGLIRKLNEKYAGMDEGASTQNPASTPTKPAQPKPAGTKPSGKVTVSNW